MAENSTKLHVNGDGSAVERRTRERNLPKHLSDYTDVPGQRKLQMIKNRRSSMKANLTKKINIIENYIKGQKNHKLIALALTQLNRPWDQLREP